MKKNDITCLLNNSTEAATPSLFEFANFEIAENVERFHQSLPGYKPTPLVSLSQLANRLGVGRIFVKDESHRFDLNAFKVLGASYAMARHLAKRCGLRKNELDFTKITANKSEYQNITFVTATDGNHGRAVAWAAKLFGCRSVVYMPKNSSPARLEAIRGDGAKASILSVNYDEAVIHANKKAQEEGWVLLQDTSWKGYEAVPRFIMQGYFTLITEYIHQERSAWPTHLFLQAGVGSFAAAIVAYMCNFKDRPTPEFVIVEPQGAPCLYESNRLNTGDPIRIDGDLTTIMAGLACGEPSHLGWDILKSAASAFLKCSDDVARRGMKILGNPLKGDRRVISGESGAVTSGALFEVLSNKEYNTMKQDLGIDRDSTILIISTEGDTDPAMYRDIVWQ